MKKALKITGKILLGILILLLALLLVVFIYHRVMLSKEKTLLEPLGQMVEVDGNNMSIYTEGEGDHTIVIMSGAGMVSPILDYSPLYRKLSDTYKIAVIEKFGYGFSDVVDGERDFDTILRQDREALQKAGIEAPYILCPHSMSGIEAILWAQKYPNEVEALIGLDMSTPKAYTEEELADDGKAMVAFYTLLRESGLGRLVLTDDSVSDNLDQHEKDIYKAIAYTKFANKNASNAITFTECKNGKVYVAGSCNYKYNPTITVPEGYIVKSQPQSYYFEKYNALLTDEFVSTMNQPDGVKEELKKLNAAIRRTKSEAASRYARGEGAYLFKQHGANEYTLAEGHSVTNCGEIWSAREAILHGAKFDELSLSTYWNSKSGSRSLGEYMTKCENCQFTFGGVE